MHATHPDPRRTLVAALAALVLASIALLPAAMDDVSFSIGGGAGAAEPAAPAAAPAPARPEPAWTENPFAYPLLQVPAESAAR